MHRWYKVLAVPVSAEAWDGDANLVADTEAGAAVGPHAREGRQRGARCGSCFISHWKFLVISFSQMGYRRCFCPPPIICLFLSLCSLTQDRSGSGFFVTFNGRSLPEKLCLQSILEKQQSFTQGLAGGEIRLCTVAICLLSSWGVPGCAGGGRHRAPPCCANMMSQGGKKAMNESSWQ